MNKTSLELTQSREPFYLILLHVLCLVLLVTPFPKTVPLPSLPVYSLDSPHISLIVPSLSSWGPLQFICQQHSLELNGSAYTWIFSVNTRCSTPRSGLGWICRCEPAYGGLTEKSHVAFWLCGGLVPLSPVFVVQGSPVLQCWCFLGFRLSPTARFTLDSPTPVV